MKSLLPWRRRRPIPETLERILVVGKAKTGTTMLFKLIADRMQPGQQVFEPKDRAFESDLDIVDRHLVAKVIFEHWCLRRPEDWQSLVDNSLATRFTKRILIVRDPRDELVSRMLYVAAPLRVQGRASDERLSGWVDMLRAKEEAPDSVSLMTLIEYLEETFEPKLLSSFNRVLDAFTAFYETVPDDFTIARYEDVIDRNVIELEQFLGIELGEEPREDGHIRRTRRTAGYGNWANVFLPSDVEALEPMLREFMSAAGYADWTLNHEPTLEPSEFSEYVRRIGQQG